MKTCPICHRKTVTFFGTSSYKCSSCGIVPANRVIDKSQYDKPSHDSLDEEYGWMICFGKKEMAEGAKRNWRLFVVFFIIMLVTLLIFHFS